MTWVHERIFAAGGSHIPRTWPSFADQTGIDAVLHLNPDQPDAFAGGPPAGFLWLDVVDEDGADAPTRLLAGRFANWQVDRGGSLLIHSSLGLHRTRWVFMSFLLCRGRSLKSAMRQVQEPPWLAPYHTDDDAWRSFVDWMESLPVDIQRSAAGNPTQGG